MHKTLLINMALISCSCSQSHGDTMLIVSIANSLLASLSEITASVASAKIEQNNFLEIGSYFYRASPAIVELQTTQNTPENATTILQSLSESTNLAKSILARLQESRETTLDHDVRTTIKQLEGIINHMGEDLSLIPPSVFTDEEYAEIAVRSLSEEMKTVSFQISQASESKVNNQQLWSLYQNLPSVATGTTESDLYSISTEVCTENSHISDIPLIVESLRSVSQSNSHRRQGNVSTRSSKGETEAAQYVEPIYRSFFCPLTKQIMDDPVTIQSGVTYERSAITDYFDNYGDSEEIICPVTREKLQSTAISPNIALRNIIGEWKERNETAQLKVIRAALSIGNTEDMILDALKDLENICQSNPKKAAEVHALGIIQLLARLLELRDRTVRCNALQMLRLLAEEDEGKDLIGKTQAISATIRMLSSSYQPIRHGALLLLMELSKSQYLSEKIGWVTGGILILIQTKFNRSSDAFASEAAEQVLKNMERCPTNIKLMAENGHLEPLLKNLIEGSEERKLEMVTYLGEIILEDDSKTYVAKRTAPILIQMLQSGNSLARKVVFRALVQISSYHGNARVLVEEGTMQIMVEELFTKKLYSEPMDSLREASAILANILESGLELDNLTVNNQGHTIASGYVVFNVMYMIKNSTPDDLNLNLIRILSCLTKSSKSVVPVVSAVKESEASYTIVELLNNPSDEIAIAAIKLLTLLSSHIGHLLIDRLCKTNGLPESLIQTPSDLSKITERQALSVSLLAKLPHQNLTLNLALLSKNTILGILQSINQLHRRGRRHNRYANVYFEGLVGVLVRFTATLYDYQMLCLAINHNFTAVLTDLLMETSSDEVQRLAAVGLEKLSTQSIHLSKSPRIKRNKSLNLPYLPKLLMSKSSKMSSPQLCVAHKGVCSKQDTFCLIEARAVERLLACLDHQNVDVVEAALSALSTLLDDKVDIEQSVVMLNEMNATQQVLKAVKDHKNESLWQKAFWIIERFLKKGGQRSISIVSLDRMFAVTVVAAFHHGDAYTRQMAEKILRYLDKMPSPTATFTT